MCSAMRLREHNTVTEIRVLGHQAFSRAAGAPLSRCFIEATNCTVKVSEKGTHVQVIAKAKDRNG